MNEMSIGDVERWAVSRLRVSGARLVDVTRHADVRGYYGVLSVSDMPGKLVGFIMKSLSHEHVREGIDNAINSIAGEREARQWSAVDP